MQLTHLSCCAGAIDTAVLVAYGWPPDLPVESLLAALLALNLEHEPA